MLFCCDRFLLEIHVVFLRLHHWIVNSEDLESRFHEDRTNESDITQSLFREVQGLDPDVKLFLNNRALADSDRTFEYSNQGKRLQSHGVPVFGLGTDGTFGPLDPDYERVKFRLSKLSEAGIPIYVTGLTIVDADEDRKAEKLGDMLTLLYGHPAVQGVFLGALWDGDNFDPSAALANGNNVQINAAGKKYLNLVRHSWRTNKNFTLSPTQGYNDRAFLGEYSLRILRDGVDVHQETFTLDSRGKDVSFNPQGNIFDIYAS
ncbi:hypothetical protein FSP39_022844 [Pinctada imbricata]|uniref:GH10 domain-containing protein n=1 Tax=Pinctada imbricata TaxID=66713 RepID=A0AA89BN04_PINIB|nr:hypothetical protein FSP39_022844 [Pinctada imbricata]